MASDREKAKRAILAMRPLGVSDDKIKATLKKLLKVYEKNWDLIEEESYRALADAIFQEDEEDMVENTGNKCNSDDEENGTGDEPEQPLRMPERRSSRQVAEEHMNSSSHQEIDREAQDTPRPLKRLRRGGPGFPSPHESASRPGGITLKEPKKEADEAPNTFSEQQSRGITESRELSGNLRDESLSAQPQANARNKGEELLATYARNKGKGLLGTSNPLPTQERTYPIIPSTTKKTQVQPMEISQTDVPCQAAPVEGSSTAAHSRKSPDRTNKVILAKHVPETGMLIIPKEEPITYEISPDNNPDSIILPDQLNENLSDRNSSVGKSNIQSPSPSKPVNVNGESNVIVTSASKRSPNCDLAVTDRGSSHLEIASKDVRISVSLARQDVKAFSLEELLKSFEERCLRSYKILDPNFSAMNILNDLVESVIEVGTSSSDESSRLGSVHTDQEREMLFNISPSVDLLNKSTAREVLSAGDNSNSRRPSSPRTASNGAVNIQHPEVPHESESRSLVVVPERLTADDVRTMLCKNDITKGEEGVDVPWVNEVNNNLPPPFYYISRNFIFQSARVDFTLSQIKEDKCCSGCFGNCLESVISCACSQETGDQFAYTKEGLLREEFLEYCILVNRDPQQRVFYCEECPVERMNDDMEPCKGHLARQFIKECWSKCGCHKQCGNRVVQRGITRKLEVFYTTEGKGWGLRTLENLPKGAFVCEYVGEIVTCTELHSRKMPGTHSMQNVHPVLLDSAWSSAVLNDEESLCLDANTYGNVARFINHRCLDANLIEIPVEVDTADHHYYHLAFFTTREVEAQEELTWDYGVYFDDHGHLSKAFQCKCGSKFCRNMKRITRSRCA